MLVALFITINIFNFGNCDMEAKIVGGKEIDIIAFPHIAYIAIHCQTGDDLEAWKCGSSILNQKLLLTAAHCVAGCSSNSAIIASVGHQDHDEGESYIIHSYMTHELYNHAMLCYDIALVRLKLPLKLSATVSRIALMKKPPYGETAQVAGWGLINEAEIIDSNLLKVVTQTVHKTNVCQKKLGSMSKGTFCASSGDKNHYASFGDSGGPLVVRGYIQIGLVSYKLPQVSADMIVYTDTGYFYNWIVYNSKKILSNCNK